MMTVPSLAKNLVRGLVITTAATLIATMTGCAGSGSSAVSATKPASATKPRLQGKVHGGQQPISGATIQLYAVGTSGIKSASTPLLNPAATTDQNGNFDITGQYACPQLGSLVYITATGGNPGLSSGTNNPAIGLMAAIGACNYATTDSAGNVIYTLDPTSFIFMNEVTTAAAVYALAPFLQDYANVGSSSNQLGIADGFNTAAMLANIGTGTTPGSALPSTVSYDANTGFPVVLSTLADIIATCINSDGTGKSCTLLFNFTTVNGTRPANTIAAMLAIATNPALSPSNLLDLIAPSAPFNPILNTAPNDWTIALHYTGLHLSTPNGIAFDGSGNLWIANQTSNNISELYSGSNGLNSAGSVAQYTAGGILGPQAIAIDQSNQVWIANTAGNSVVELDNGGNVLSGNGYTSGGINAPNAIAIDSNGNAWITNFNGNSITQLLSNGTPSSFSPITQGAYPVSLPTGIAIDSNNQVWVSNSGLSEISGLAAQVLRFDQNGNPQPSMYQTLQGPLGMAIDRYDRVWIAGNGNSLVAAFKSTGAFAVPAGVVSGGGLNQSAGVAVDGEGALWITNSAASGSLTELAANTGTAISPTTGFGALNMPQGVAVDPSGNVWTANSGDNTLTEFVGLASPTVTPIAANVLTAIPGVKPGRPGVPTK